MAITGDDLHRVLVDLNTNTVEVQRGVFEVVAAIKGKGGGEGGGEDKQPKAKGNVFEQFANKATRAGVALGGFVIVFDRMMDAMGRQMTRFVALANPAAVMRFNIALDNAMSAMGRIFLPILERFTGMIQGVGNAIESLSPQAKAVIGALTASGGLAVVLYGIAIAAGVLMKTLGSWVGIISLVVSVVMGVMATMGEGKQIMSALGGVMKAVGSIIEVLTQIFVVLFMPVIKTVATVVREVCIAIADIIRWLARQVGLEMPDFDPNKKQAMAVRQSQVSDLRSFANRAYSTAFGGAASDVNKDILTENEKQTKILEQIRDGKKGENAPGEPHEKYRSPYSPDPEGLTPRRHGMGHRIRGVQRDLYEWTRDRMRSIFG